MKNTDNLYMDIAKRLSDMSYAQRAKVGSIIVKDRCIIAEGWNGMPRGFDNICEEININGEIKTRNEVIHAEANAILKCARLGISVEGATLYCTLSPCFECSKMILQSGIKRLIYLDEYKGDLGSIDFLKKTGQVEVFKFSEILEF